MYTSFDKTYHHLTTLDAEDIHCPLCNSIDTISMEFYQVEVDNGYASAKSRAISALAHCEHCDAHIPVIKWTPELDAFYRAEKKGIPLETSYSIHKSSKKVILGSIIAIPIIAIVGIGLIMLASGTGGGQRITSSIASMTSPTNPFITEPQIGDIIKWRTNKSESRISDIVSIDTASNTLTIEPSRLGGRTTGDNLGGAYELDAYTSDQQLIKKGTTESIGTVISATRPIQ